MLIFHFVLFTVIVIRSCLNLPISVEGHTCIFNQWDNTRPLRQQLYDLSFGIVSWIIQTCLHMVGWLVGW